MFHKRQTPSHRARLAILRLEDRSNPSTSTAFLATDLIADQPGVAAITDPTLTNAWGISLNPNGGAFWISANHGDVSEVYGGDVNGSAITQPFKVAIQRATPPSERQSLLQRMILHHLFPYPRRVKLSLIPARILQSVGALDLMERVGLTKLLPPTLRRRACCAASGACPVPSSILTF